MASSNQQNSSQQPSQRQETQQKFGRQSADMLKRLKRQIEGEETPQTDDSEQLQAGIFGKKGSNAGSHIRDNDIPLA